MVLRPPVLLLRVRTLRPEALVDRVSAAPGRGTTLERGSLREDGTTERLAGAERACELVRETWRAFEEFNLSPPLALEALFVKLRRELGATPLLV